MHFHPFMVRGKLYARRCLYAYARPFLLRFFQAADRIMVSQRNCF